MKKIWSYIAMFFIGLAAGIVAGVKLMGDQVEINIKRIKTKKGESNIDIPIDIQKPAESRQSKRQARKLAKKEAKKWKNPG